MTLTNWIRVEPEARSEELPARNACVHDPLWLLGRQWQFGEFEGEDAGSPIELSYALVSDSMTRYQLGDGEPQPYGGSGDGSESPPLEPLVEREPVRPRTNESRTDIRQAVEAGEHFLRLLRQAEVTGQDGSPLEPADFPEFRLDAAEWDAAELDEEEERYAMVVSGRVLDGEALLQAFEDDTREHPTPAAIQNLDRERYEEAVTRFCTWYRDMYDEPAPDESSAWDPDRMEYRFAVSTGADATETVFEADSYESGHLDWHSFSVDDDRSLQTEAEGEAEPTEPEGEPATETRENRMVPTVASYPGMPAPRYWEFEDGNVNLPAIDMAAEDLSRLIIQEFGLVSGDDWFVAPVPMTVGSLGRITNLEVTTTFGERHEIDSLLEEDRGEGTSLWNMYTFPETADGSGPGLFLPPLLADTLETEAVEEVEFARDEMANVGWAIERTVEGSIGQALSREEARSGATAPPTEPTAGPVEAGESEAVYRLMGSVPEYWFPLLPQPATPGAIGEIHLKLGRLLSTDPESASAPHGRILDEQDLDIPEEEVSRAGTTVTRTYQLARWMDGSTRVWSGRTAQVGRGDVSSGLEFDWLEEETPNSG
ncbi:hypothetical protein [Halobellus litoreus]|uniref:Uncharacterized protein n=1 Tax=Halobellus litoreus TaxID=755310 RepID=A0ABD6E3G8_9EURY|nr:hypothetical protein [Halobellus litoreus]